MIQAVYTHKNGFETDEKPKSTLSCVNDKISGVFVTRIRPLNEGEKPKHPGEKQVFEATNELSPTFKEALSSGEPIVASWKIDGTCCKIENGVYYRRRDIRKGSVPPPGSILGDVDENGVAKIAWIPLNESHDPEDKYHLSAMTDTRHYVYVMNKNKSFYLLDLSSVTTACTFELIGPKVQDNPYSIETIDVDVKIKNSVQKIPRHYLIPHGAFLIPFPIEWFQLDNPLDLMKQFVMLNSAEGIVFRCGNNYFKVNQGHLATFNRGSKLLLAGMQYDKIELKNGRVCLLVLE